MGGGEGGLKTPHIIQRTKYIVSLLIISKLRAWPTKLFSMLIHKMRLSKVFHPYKEVLACGSHCAKRSLQALISLASSKNNWQVFFCKFGHLKFLRLFQASPSNWRCLSPIIYILMIKLIYCEKATIFFQPSQNIWTLQGRRNEIFPSKPTAIALH